MEPKETVEIMEVLNPDRDPVPPFLRARAQIMP